MLPLAAAASRAAASCIRHCHAAMTLATPPIDAAAITLPRFTPLNDYAAAAIFRRQPIIAIDY